MKRTIEIIKAKLIEGRNLKVEYNEIIPDGTASISQVCPAAIHTDLRAAFAKLGTHLARLCEQFNDEGGLVTQIECRSFSLKGDDENEGLTLTGLRKLSDERMLLLNSPFLKFEEEDRYPHMNELLADLHIVKEELTAYLLDNKHAPDPQLSLFDDQQTKETPTAEMPQQLTEEQAVEEANKLNREQVMAENARKNQKKSNEQNN